MRVIILCFLLLTSCMVGPKYVEPCFEGATEYTEEMPTYGTVVDLKTWWKQFNDPTLDEIIDVAIEKNYDLLIALNRIEEVRARYQFSSAELWPEIDLNASVQKEQISEALYLSTFEGPSIQNLYLFGFDASWEIDLFGRLRRLKEASYYELQASQEEFRDIYITLLAEVARVYASFRSLQERIEINQEQIRVAEELLNLSKARYEAGIRSEIEPSDVSAELNTFRAALPPLQNSLNEAVYSLAVLLGMQPEEVPAKWFESKPIPKANGKIPVGVPSELLRRRPDIRKEERLLAATNSYIGASLAKLFPTFSLTASFGYQADNASDWFSSKAKSWSVGPNVFWPLVDFGRIRSDIDLTKASNRVAYFRYEKVVIEALKEVENSLSAYFNEEKRLIKLSSKVEDLARTRDLMKIKYVAGIASLTEVLNVEQNLLFAEQSYITSEQTLSENLMAVYKSLGGDWTCCNTP